jgi:hypothetical protein
MPGPDRGQDRDAELGRLLNQPFEPNALDWREQQPKITFGFRWAKAAFDNQRCSVALSAVDPAQPFAACRVERGNGSARPKPQHITQMVRRPGCEFDTLPFRRQLRQIKARFGALTHAAGLTHPWGSRPAINRLDHIPELGRITISGKFGILSIKHSAKRG